MLPWHRKTEKYGGYWHMNKGEYPYKIFFYEKENDKYSCKDKFPITCPDKTVFTKDSFVEYIQKALKQINEMNLGITFNYLGCESTDSDDLAFLMKDGVNAMVYYFEPQWGGLSAPFSENEFGIKLALINNVRKEWFIGSIRHEMAHALGFDHKDDNYKGITKQVVINGFDNLGEFTADTIHGIKTVYDIESKYIINGNIKDTNGLENLQVFIYNAKTKEILYQSPVDSTGYFEFRLDYPIRKFNVLAIGKKEQQYYFGKLSKHRTLGRRRGKHTLDELKLLNFCENTTFIKDRLSIVL